MMIMIVIVLVICFETHLVFTPSKNKIAPHKYMVYSQNPHKKVAHFSLHPNIPNVYFHFWVRLPLYW